MPSGVPGLKPDDAFLIVSVLVLCSYSELMNMSRDEFDIIVSDFPDVRKTVEDMSIDRLHLIQTSIHELESKIAHEEAGSDTSHNCAVACRCIHGKHDCGSQNYRSMRSLTQEWQSVCTGETSHDLYCPGDARPMQ